MYRIEVSNGINQITSVFYYLGLWHRGEEPTARETRIKMFYFIYFMLLSISFLSGAVSSDNTDESIFLVECAIISAVSALKLFFIIWKKKQILELLNGICVYSIDDYDYFKLVNDILNRFVKCAQALYGVTNFGAFCSVFIAPFLGTERRLFFNIGFPLDWKNNETSYWAAFTFLSTEMFLTTIASCLSIIIWYLMINCVLKYIVLGNQIRNMGVIRPIPVLIESRGHTRKMSEMEKQNTYLGHLTDAVKCHWHIRDLINQLESFFSVIFFAILAISSLCICVSIYSLVFSHGDKMEYIICLVALFYNLFEIFMVMYFGNEITLSSDSLSYCLFESNWVDQPLSSKKCVIIFGEILKQPYVLMIGKIYPLNLGTFTRILRSAYNMFNILQNLNQH